MNTADQVILVLQLLLTMGPLAVYFLGLGLISSRANPSLVSERSDFTLLAVAFVPVIVWPLVGLIQAGHLFTAAAVIVTVPLLFMRLLPDSRNGWVIYNISTSECLQGLTRAARRCGWRLESSTTIDGHLEVEVPAADLVVSFSSMPWLRTVTLRVRPLEGRSTTNGRPLADALARELSHEAMLPSPTGAGLVVIGAALLCLPMWYVFENMDAIVDVVRRLLLA